MPKKSNRINQWLIQMAFLDHFSSLNNANQHQNDGRDQENVYKTAYGI